ncbi:MAG TPA: RES domain-containing protein [Gemmatimonadaceae bacterium]|nr:RES domain-containing protein [Gemmatimonadaceae bacterium]
MVSPPERTLHEPLRVVRLHHPRFAALDASGAQTYGGRWNSPGGAIVYAALAYGAAVLETRVHALADRPPRREIAVITIPPGVRVSEIDARDLPGWDDDDQVASRREGDAWIADGKTVALIVPSRAGAPLERNIAINLAHPDAKKLRVESLGLVPWDLRLFGERRARRAPTPRKKK